MVGVQFEGVRLVACELNGRQCKLLAMDLTKAGYRPRAENESHKCGRDDCHENAIVLVTEYTPEGIKKASERPL